MYIPRHFRQSDLPAIQKFIEENPFATLVTQNENGPTATHIPLTLELKENNRWIVTGHLAKANPQAQLLKDGDEALAIFQGPHHYISSAWYNHPNVPTWNFIAVHLKGRVLLHNDDEVKASISSMMERYEPEGESPASISNVPPDMLRRLYRGVQGFEIQVEEIDGKWKLSQNRDAESYANVISELEKIGSEQAVGIADAMRENK